MSKKNINNRKPWLYWERFSAITIKKSLYYGLDIGYFQKCNLKKISNIKNFNK